MKGLTFFEFDPSSGTVIEAVWKPGSIFCSVNDDVSTTVETYVLQKNEGCLYLKALNLKNAIRKFEKLTPQNTIEG